MLCPHIEHSELSLQSRSHHFVHHRILPIELNSHHSIFQVTVSKELVGSQVKELDVSIVVASHEAPFLLVVRVPEPDSSTVRQYL